jgi:hypothetical protein
MTGRPALVSQHDLFVAVSGSEFWESYLSLAFTSRTVRIHLAVFQEPYLRYIIDGSKTIESRFSRNTCAPYGRVDTGDILLLKRSGGPVEALCRAADAWFYQLEPSSWSEIRHRFGKSLRVSDEFLLSRAQACFATLIRIDEVYPVSPVSVNKRDRRGWVVLHDTLLQDGAATEQLALGV